MNVDAVNVGQPEWYPGGPTFNFLPLPAVNPISTWGKKCPTCVNECSGHYVWDPELLENKHFELAELPSKILADYFKMNNEEIKEEDLESLAQRCYLKISEVKLWLEHLKQISENRKRGAKKAADTRRKNVLCRTLTDLRIYSCLS